MKFKVEDIPVFSYVDLSPDGKYLIFPESTAILGLFSDGRVLLVEQHRSSINKRTLELPGGRANSGEFAEDTIKRELFEETGYSCQNIRLLFNLDMDFSASIHRTNVFIGDITTKSKPTENFINHKLDLKEIIKLIKEGTITHATTIAAVYWLKSEVGD